MSQYDSWDYLTNFLQKNPGNYQEELAKAPFSVKVKNHQDRPDLVMFKYSQFESDFTNPVVRCCRGPVYKISGGKFSPYLMPFFKFSNYGEKGADPLDWNHTLFVRDKLDGSLLKLLRETDGNYLWTTNGSFDLSVEVMEIYNAKTSEKLEAPYTFASLRDYALLKHTEDLKRIPPLWTFMFELTSPFNKIIVPYSETKLTLLGCRDTEGTEHTPEWAVENFSLSFETPKIYKLNSIDEVLSYCKSINSNDREGVVVQDGNFNRLKIKTEHYRSLFFLKGEDHFSDEKIFSSIKQGSIDDALAAWPEIRPKTEEIIAEWIGFRNNIKIICAKMNEYYKKCCNDFPLDPKEAKKRYAMNVLENYKTLSTFLFEAIKEDSGVESLLDKINYTELKNHWIPAVESAG